MIRLLGVLLLTGVLVACGDDAATSSSELETRSDELYPDVVGVEAGKSPDGTWRFDVTVSSPYDSPQRYADAWRVLGPDGTELGVRELAHDHAAEQPFTRSLSGVVVPETTDVVTVQARDQRNGWGGATVELTLDR